MDYEIKKANTLNVKLLLIAIITTFFVLERLIVEHISFAGYFDELFTILCCCTSIYIAFCQNQKLTRSEIVALIFTVLVIVIGLLGNVISGLMNNPFLIIVDIISTVKIIIAYYWIMGFKMPKEDWDKTIRLLAKWMRIFVIIMFIVWVFAYAMDLGILGEVRHGIKSYSFIMSSAGNYSKMFYFIIPLLTADLMYGNTLYKKIIIAIALILWASSLRSRAIAFAVCYVAFAFWFFYMKDKRVKKINVLYLMPIAIVGLVLGWEQLVFYFTTDTQARSMLLRYSIVTMKDYFPLGSGFGTYGSDIAKTHYSVLYERYGFLDVYGIGKVHTDYLNDNYWPMIMGQFGVIGTILVVAILFLLYKRMIDAVIKNKYLYFSTLCMMGFLVVSSIASKSYSEFSMIPIFLLHGIFVQREKSNSDLYLKE